MEKYPSYIPPESMASEDPLFLLYTSGSTGKPKGIMHGTAGYLLGAAATGKYVFDIHDDDVFFCGAVRRPSQGRAAYRACGGCVRRQLSSADAARSERRKRDTYLNVYKGYYVSYPRSRVDLFT